MNTILNQNPKWGNYFLSSPVSIKATFNYKLLLFSFFLLILNPFHAYSQNPTVTFTAGSYIIDMGTDTLDINIDNGLKPYGLVYELLMQGVPISWAIRSDKLKDEVDFSANGKDYSGGSFIISFENLTPNAFITLDNWSVDENVIVDKIPVSFDAPIFSELFYWPTVLIDDKGGKVTDYYKNAGFEKFLDVPYVTGGDPLQIDECIDVYAMPEIIPDDWTTDQNVIDSLVNFVTTKKGNLWAANEAVSELENTLDCNFLSTIGLIPESDHAGSTAPFDYDEAYSDHPIMQFISILDEATDNGDEEVYIEKNGWRATTNIAVCNQDFIHDHSTYPNSDTAAILVFGRAFGADTCGMVMYEAGKDHTSGEDWEQVAAQRAFFNFLLYTGLDAEIEITPDIASLPDLNGDCSLVSAPTATVNCTGPIITASTTDDYSTQGAHVVTWTYNFGTGSTLDQDQNITINDVTPPIAIAQNVIVRLDILGNGSTTADLVDNGSNDACGIVSLVLSKTDFTTADIDTNPNEVTLTVEDAEGNKSEATAYVTVKPALIDPNPIITFSPGAYIIDMGTPVQTVENGLKPYGLVYSLVIDNRVPVSWAIRSGKIKDAVDFTANGKDYRAGSFIIAAEYVTPAVVANINAWRDKDVIVDLVPGAFDAPIFDKISSWPTAVLDEDNGDIVAKYYVNAEVPSDSYQLEGSPTAINPCHNIYILPHADPQKWVDGEKDTLINFVTQKKGFLWTGCHAVSAIESLPGSNFLSSNELILWGVHADADLNNTAPFDYDDDYSDNPIMQFMGLLDGATENGSEQIYIPIDGWRPTTSIAVYDQDFIHNYATYPNSDDAAVLVYGRAFGNENYGMVMYEAGHDHNKSGEDWEKVAAQRAFFNFLLYTSIELRAEITTNLTDCACDGTNTFTASVQGGVPPYAFEWISSNGGIIDDFTAATINYTPPAGFTEDVITLSVVDSCSGAMSLFSKHIVINSIPWTIDTAATDLSVECDGAGNLANLNAWLANHGGATVSDNCINMTWTNNFIALSDLCGETGEATVIFTATDDCGNTESTTATFTIKDTAAPTFTQPSDISIYSEDNPYDLFFTGDVTDEQDNCSHALEAFYTDAVDYSDPNAILITRTWSLTDNCSNTTTLNQIITILKINTSTDLLIKKTGPAAANPGDIINYTISYQNISGNPASNVKITDFLPLDTYGTFLSSEPAGTIVGNTITWTSLQIPHLASLDNESHSIDIQFRVGVADGSLSPDGFYIPSSPITLENSAQIESDEITDPVQSNTVYTNVTQYCGTNDLPNLIGEVKSNKDSYLLRLIAITNTGNVYDQFEINLAEGAGSDVVLLKQILDLDKISISGPANTVATATTAWLAPNETAFFFIKLIVDQSPSNRTNYTKITLTSTVCNSLLQSENLTTYIHNTSDPDIYLLKFGTPGTAKSGDTLNYTLFVYNSNGEMAYDVVLKETYPLGTTVISINPDNGGSNVWNLGDIDQTNPKIIHIAVKTDDNALCFSKTITNTANVIYTGLADSIASTVSTLIESTPLAISNITSSNITCNGLSDGTITAEATGGPGLEYNLLFSATSGGSFVNAAATNGDIDGSYTGLLTGFYKVRISDDCIAPFFPIESIEVEITEPSALTVTGLELNAVSCFGGSDGSATITAEGGTGPYTFLWDDDLAQTTETATGLIADTYHVNVTDANNCIITAEPVVTVIDNEFPSVVTKDISINLDASGAASILPADVDNGTSDNCSFTLAVSPNTFDCTNTGANTVTLTATDGSGNVSTADAVITVIDNEFPSVVTKDISINLDASGAASILAADVDNGTTDNCSFTLAVSPNTFDCANTGANTVTLTATDASGNISSLTAVVTVIDNEFPSVVTKDISINLNASGAASILPADVDDGTSDNCNFTLDVSPNTFDCSNTGANTVTLTATDASGNISSLTAVVTVIDNTFPTMATTDITINLDASGDASIVPADVDDGTFDNCTFTLGVAPNTFDCSNTGANTVTLTATDGSGNVSTADAVVTVIDNEFPSVVTKDISINLDASGAASILAADVDNGTTDNCSFTLAVSPNTFDCANTGANTVTLTATDASGNISSLTAVVTVIDNEFPSVVTKDISINLNASGAASILPADVDNGTSDNCSFTLDVSPNTFDCANTGANTVTLTATDASGNISSLTAVVTVIDNTFPTMATTDITINLDASGDASIVPADVDDGTFDNCTFTLGVAPNTFDCTNTGANTVTLTATDASNNVSTKTAVVTVVDNTFPTMATTDITINLDASGDASIVPADVDDGTFDNCTFTLGVAPNTFDCSNTGDNTVTLTATDASGNISSLTAVVTVIDNEFPSVVTKDISINLNASGAASILPADVDNGTTDNCSFTLAISPNTFDCSNTGANTVTLTAKDASGNISSLTANVTVIDNEFPSVVTKDISINLNASGAASILPADVDDGSSDSCGIASLALDKTAFSCTDIGGNAVTLTVTDVNGNVSTANATVTVVDNIDPVALAQNITIQLDALGAATINAANIDNGSNDACGIASLALDKTAFSCADIGSNTVTLTVIDVNGNVSTANATVTVVDNVDPVALVQNITIQLDALGAATINATNIDNGSNDACGIASLALDKTAFSCADVISSPNTVTLIVTDNNGNVSTTTALVTVVDNSPPIVSEPLDQTIEACGTFKLSDPTSGISNLSYSTTAVTISITQLNTEGITASDNCGIASITYIDKTNGESCPEIITRTFNVKDDCGNITAVDYDITFTETTAPTASNPADLYVQCRSEAIFDSEAIIDEADNCSIFPLVEYIGNVSDGLSCPETITGTYRITDNCYNSILVTQKIIVLDTIKPTASNPQPIDDIERIEDIPLPDISVVFDAADNCIERPIVEFIVDIPEDVSNELPIIRTVNRWYNVSDSCDNSIDVVQKIYINGFPYPEDDTYPIDENSKDNVLNVLENDDFGGDGPGEYSPEGGKIRIVSYPEHGDISIGRSSSNQIEDYILYTPSINDYFLVDTFQYAIIDLSGDEDIATVYIDFIPSPLFIPEGISPDGDGNNDFFQILGLIEYPNNSIVIFDQSGKTVFKAGPYLNDWDGRDMFNGNLLPQDTYYYQFDKGDGSRKITGFVYIVRKY